MSQCRLCNNGEIKELLNLGLQPISKNLLSNQDQAYEIFPLVLSYCNKCYFVQLRETIPAEKLYTDVKGLSSNKNQPHIPKILELIKEINANSSVLEIGCNDGSFLDEIRKIGYTDITGIEPSTDGWSIADEKYHVYHDYFSTDSDICGIAFDLIICRHVLEHVWDLADFGDALQSVCKIGTKLIIEVPDFGFSLKLTDYSTIWEEHCNYFTEKNLIKYLSSIGIQVLKTERYNYSGQSLLVVGEYVGKLAETEGDFWWTIHSYRANWQRYNYLLKCKLEEMNKDICIYGAGARGSTLVNITDIKEYLSFFVDDQIEKQDKFVPGCNLPIYSPDRLNESRACLLAVNTENDELVKVKNSSYTGYFYPLLPLSGWIQPV